MGHGRFRGNTPARRACSCLNPVSTAILRIVEALVCVIATNNHGTQTMLKFYYSLAPNPTKVALFLEEAGLAYDAIPVDTRKGDQHKPEYLAINPKSRVPVLMTDEGVISEAPAILAYVADTHPDSGLGGPATPFARAQLFSFTVVF